MVSDTGTIENRGFLAHQRRRNNARNGLTDDFICRKAEHRFGRAVPRCHDATQILAHNRVI
jgi:hypothetical protein